MATSERPPTPAAWLSLDETDSDLVDFLRYFVAAIRTAFPESCADTLAMLQAPDRYRRRLVVALSNDIEQWPRGCVLVLDDYHAIHGKTVHDFLSEMLRHWPQRLHLVLISRNNPPLPLVNLRAKGLITETAPMICVSQRRKRPDVRQAVRAPVEQSTLPRCKSARRADRRSSSGNPLVARHGEPRHGLAGFDQRRIGHRRLPGGRGLQRQPPAIRSFLLKTSILNRFCTDLCEVLVGSEFSWFRHACVYGLA